MNAFVMAAEPIRIGLVARSTHLPAWQGDLIVALLKEPRVTVEVFAAIGGSLPRTKGPWPSRTVIRHRTRGKGFPHLRTRDVEELIKGTPSLHGAVSDIHEDLRKLDLDLLLDLTSTHVTGLKGLTKHGIWWFQERRPSGWGAVPPGVVEYIRGVHHARIDLWHADVQGACRKLRTCTFLVNKERLDQTLCDVHAHLAHWPADLLRVHGVLVPADAEHEEDATLTLTPPDLWQRASAWVKAGSFRRPYTQPAIEWNIGVLPQPIAHLLEERPSLNVRWLPAPRMGSHRMEPFPYLDHEQELNVIYRKMTPQGPSTFSRVRPKSDNNLKRSRELLKLANSVHYPYTLATDQGPQVVIAMHHPERIELHSLDVRNDELAKRQVLMSGALHSPTLFPWNGKWWLMGTSVDLEQEALYIHWADDITGPFTPHPLNPVRVDARGARPAGTPFIHGGKLWRPGSDTTNSLFPRVVIHEVLVLNENDFQERAHTWIGPFKGSQYPAGVLTISAMGDVTMVDGCRTVTRSHVRTAKDRSRERKKARSNKP
ncbi:MAG: hypothetical protein KA817_11550 [Flavobacteriales bacterium]|nr:hypothetical protein [Flavobacteriales bacterium]